ncbi:hypothetical protein HU200_017959 [Digitaria exilis]|uniref:Uncharacterized protein n=1 Tax=Digitaria exilis TaxID=1010633 RepID=A0A835KH44_9POAL|nr:hypothetical protein HU200_017959 [Digitaria exilis]CAB3500803.1 unnamed protein product [Digitaria exilis]
MKGKRVGVAALYFVLVMLSGQRHVAGFCGFFGECYPGCREGHPGWFCTAKCVENCAVGPREVPVAAFGSGDCSKICLSSICGTAEASDGPPDASSAAACVDDCTENWKLYESKHT